MNGKKRVLAWLILSILFFIPGVLAASTSVIKTYHGSFDTIKLMVDGQEYKPKTPPFVLVDEGVTMVALRDLSEMLGFQVDWDSNKGIVHIKSRGSNASQSGSAEDYNVNIEAMKIIRNIGPFYERSINSYQIAGRNFSAGMAVTVTAEKDAEVVIDLNRKFASMQGYFGIDDLSMNSKGGFLLTILGDDREIYQSEIVKPSDYPRHIPPGRLDLTHVNRLTIRISWVEKEMGDYDWLTAVLANARFLEKQESLTNHLN